MSSPDDTSPIATVDRPASDAAPQASPSRGSGGELWRLLGVAAIPTLAYFVLVLRHMTYAWDDFIQFGVTLQAGISRELLTYSLFEHFGPLNRMVHGVLLLWGGLDPRWAIALAVPIFFVYCLALADLARLLGAGWGRTAICLAVATVTPASVFVAAFLDPYFHVMVPLGSLVVATAAYVRWTRDRRLLHAATGTLAVLVACSVQERGVFIVLFLVLARVLVIDGGVPVRAWIRTLLRDWPFLLGPGLIAVTIAAVVALVYAADAERGGIGETAALVVQAWAMRLVPMVSGVYGAGSGTVEVALIVLANVVVVALLAWAIRRNSWNVRPLALLVLWFGFNMAFVGFGRLGVGVLETFRDDPNFYAYAMPAVVMLIACLRPPEGAARLAAGGGRRWPLVQLGIALVMAVLVVVSALPLSHRSAKHNPEYLANSIRSVRAADGGDPVAVAPTRVPYGLVPPGFFPYNSGEFLIREIDRANVVDVDPERPLFLDTTGTLTPASAELLARLEPDAATEPWQLTNATGGPRGSDFCLTADGAGNLSVPLKDRVEVPGGAAWLRVVADGRDTYGSASSADGATQSLSAPAPVSSPRGSVSYLLPAQGITQVQLMNVRAGELCIQALELWTLAADGPEGCGWVGPDGQIVRPEDDAAGAPQCPRD